MEAAEALLGGAAAVLLDLRLALDPLRVVAGEAHCPQEEEQFFLGGPGKKGRDRLTAKRTKESQGQQDRSGA